MTHKQFLRKKYPKKQSIEDIIRKGHLDRLQMELMQRKIKAMQEQAAALLILKKEQEKCKQQ